MSEGWGQIISGKYRLLSVLGEGAMGVVYRAAQLDAEGQVLREVALKMIQLTFSRDPDFTRRFLREMRVTARLRNSHTVTVYDTGQSETGQLYYSMELVDGPTLREVLRRHRVLPVARAVNIVGQVCEALEEAHSLPEPIVHRDLKPANIFVETQQGQDWLKVGDFGIAKVMGEHTSGLTHTGASLGTPRYMAPEQWKGKAIDGRADLYAVGIMLYELLTGKVPFLGGDGPLSLMYQHLHEPPPPLPESIPAGMRWQVEKLLAKAPEERPASALQVRHVLEAALTGEDVRSTVILTERQSVTPSQSEPERRQGSEQFPVMAEQVTVVPHTMLQPATVVQPQFRAATTRSTTRELRLWRYGAVGSLLLLGLVFGGLWDHFHQPPIEKNQQSATRQEVATPKLHPQEQPSQRQDQVQPTESAEDIARKAKESKKMEEAQRVTDLLERAKKQRAANQLMKPEGNNAVETYQELLRVSPEHREAVLGLKEIKERYKELGEAAEQRGESAKAQAHYKAALKIDPRDETLSAALRLLQVPKEIEMSMSGAYDGKILSSSICDLSEGDRRVCQNLTIKLNSSKVIRVWAWGGAVEIHNDRGDVIYRYNPSDSSADMGNKFYGAIGKLKKGTNVWVNISCGDPDDGSGCSVNKIRLK